MIWGFSTHVPVTVTVCGPILSREASAALMVVKAPGVAPEQSTVTLAAQAAAGKPDGVAGPQSGHASLQGACSAAAVRGLRAHPAGQPSLTAQAPALRLHGVRYQVKDVSRAVAFYTTHLGFNLEHQQLPAFAALDPWSGLRFRGLPVGHTSAACCRTFPTISFDGS